jgi:hypothetical protein
VVISSKNESSFILRRAQGVVNRLYGVRGWPGHDVDANGDGNERICHHKRPKPAFVTIKVTVLVISVIISIPLDYRE